MINKNLWKSLACRNGNEIVIQIWNNPHVMYMTIYVKRAMRQNTFGMSFYVLYLSWIILLRLNPEVWRFTYYRISFEDCEGTLCSYQLGEAIIATYRLTSAIFYVLLEWITWCLRPRWWDTSPVEGLGVSDLASMPWADACSSVMPLGATSESNPGGISWEPGSSDSSFHSSIGMGMLDDLLRCHSFARVKFSYVASSECSSTRFL